MRYTKSLGTVAVLLLVSPVVLHAVFAVVPGMESYVVASQSMAPAITAGSLVYVADTGTYEVGDVVTFRRGGHTVTHRVVEVKPDGYVTKGDANDGPDAPITRDQIVGEVVLSIPLYGYLFDVASTPAGYGVLIVVPALLLVGIELRQYLDDDRP